MNQVFQKFVQDLRVGMFDDSLKQVKELIENRRSKLAQLDSVAMVPGSHVVIVAPIRPMYLIGHVAVVRKVNLTTVSVSLLQPIHAFKDCNIPLTCVEAISQEKVDEYLKKMNIAPTGPTAVRKNRWNGFQMVDDDSEIERRIAKAQAQD